MSDQTLYLIAYDISNDRRRTRVHKLLCGYGGWTQYSLFECWLTKKHHVELRAKLNKLVDKQADSIRIYGLCAGCTVRAETIGSSAPRAPETFML